MNRTAFRHVLSAAAAMSFAAAAQADIHYFSFTYNDSYNAAEGYLSASTNSAGTLTAFEGSLLVNFGPLAGYYPLLPSLKPDSTSPWISPTGAFIVDNQLLPSKAEPLNFYGLLFGFKGLEINIWGNGSSAPFSMWASSGNGYSYSNDKGQFTITDYAPPIPGSDVPAPATAAVFALGGLVATRRMR